jgi:hypothetical protein
MKQLLYNRLDEMSFLGVLIGATMLMASLVHEDFRLLLLPALAVLLPSVIYGAR